MLKACWDCLAGSDLNRSGTQVEEPYDIINLKQNSNLAPPWPQPILTNEKMFILPKILSSNDKIIVKGETFSQRNQLTIGLVTGFNSPDHSNVACQLNIHFNNPDKIAIQIIENGNAETINEENAATDYFTDSQFEIQFQVRSPEFLDVAIGDSYLDSVKLRHDVNNIRFLTVHGDVNKVSRLDFNFG